MSLVTLGVKAECLLKALVSGGQYRGIVKVNIDLPLFRWHFETKETKLKVGCFRSALSRKPIEK